MPYSDAELEQQVRRRLLEIAGRYPQAEIARRIGVRRSTVNRYFGSNRIPAAFLSAVAREFGVNASWLLLGEGAPWIADVRADQAQMGRGLLELVEAMGRVSKLKIGALAGREQAKSLRELNDALESFERLRARLAQQSRGTYAKVLADWQTSLAQGEMEQAARLREAADQVSRLCPDAELELERERMLAKHEYSMGRRQQALVHNQRVFLASLPTSARLDQKMLSAAFGVVISLTSMGRDAEAARFAEAMLLLAPEAVNWPGYPQFLGLRGWTLVQLGDIDRGLPMLTRAMSQARDPSLRDNLQVSIAYALYVSGGQDLRALAASHGSESVVRRLLLLAPWSLDAAEVELLHRVHERLAGAKAREQKSKAARAHLLALTGRHAEAMEQWLEAEREEQTLEMPFSSNFVNPVMRTQLLRLAGKTADARETLAEAERARQAIPPEVNVEFNWQRIHWRNVVSLCTPDTATDRVLLTQAADFAHKSRGKGLVAHELSAAPVAPRKRGATTRRIAPRA